MSIRLPGQTGYLAVAEQLRAAILAGVYSPGGQLPSQRHLCFELDCGVDTLRDAITVLRRELLVCTRRGFRATVCPPPQRADILLPHGGHVTAWMPAWQDLPTLGIEPEMPILTVTGPDGSIARYPADRARLVVPVDTARSL